MSSLSCQIASVKVPSRSNVDMPRSVLDETLLKILSC